MSEMFRRAFLEKMSGFDETDRRQYKCCVCREMIAGRIITAMAQKFHPECFVCTYCRWPML
jgi:LIM domain